VLRISGGVSKIRARAWWDILGVLNWLRSGVDGICASSFCRIGWFAGASGTGDRFMS
jgi:hypothetical protein